MRVEALVKRPPVTISPSATIRQAAEVFAREKVGLLVVASTVSPVKAQAVISERDIVRAVAKGTALTGQLDSVSTKKLVSVRRSDPPSKAVRLMMDNGIRHLVVENDDGTLFGVISIRDFFRETKLLQSFIKEEAEDVHGVD
ncbi:MAG: CBS domain-containing protein [Nitrososphaerota archaeon]|nr:CBS domain-containing protein [Nitrososphaerota archaeon]MDG7023881.1 CBS domain-containing protein [Nitrososphaerota archaeon]